VKAKNSKTYRLPKPRENDMLIVYDDQLTDDADQAAVDFRTRQLDYQIRSKSKGWTGLLVILRPGQRIERLDEKAAREVYRRLKRRFEPEERHAVQDSAGSAQPEADDQSARGEHSER
jgi:hydrogenase maturation factor